MTDEMAAAEIKRWTGKSPDELAEAMKRAAEAMAAFGEAWRKSVEQSLSRR